MIKEYSNKEIAQMSPQQRWNIKHRNKIRKSQYKYFIRHRSIVNYKKKIRISKRRAKIRKEES